MRFSGPLGALIEKDLRVAWRDPALKASLFMGLLSPLLFLFFMMQASGGPGPTAVLPASPPWSASPCSAPTRSGSSGAGSACS